MINLEIFNKLPQTSYLRYFLEKSYSIELLVLLYEKKSFYGIEILYHEIKFPKGDLSGFIKYIDYLNENACLVIKDNLESPKEKLVKLSAGSFLEFDAIIKFYETKFFINQKNNKRLDARAAKPGYTVFGAVTSGMDVVDAIAAVDVRSMGIYQDVPAKPIRILKARLLNPKSWTALPEPKPEPIFEMPVPLKR